MSTASPESDRASGDPITFWVRAALLGIALGIIAVFITAWRIDPYKGVGAAERMGTHQQLGLWPCTFLDVTGVPCPGCGLTTSFAYSVRADVANAARANWVGFLMVIACAITVPWALASAYHGRALWVPSLEWLVSTGTLVMFILLFIRWGFVVASVLWGRMT